MRRSFSRSPWPITVLVIVAAVLTTACTAAPGVTSATPASTPRASTMPAPSVAPTTNPTSTTVPAPTPQVLSSDGFVALEPGLRYAFPIRGTNPKISFAAPSGWSGNLTMATKDYGDSGPAGPLVFPQPFDHGFADPCTDHTPVVPAAGSGAAGLLGVIAGQPGIDAGPITDVTVGGHDGKFVDYVVTADPARCGNGEDGFWIWGTCPAPVTIGCEDVGTGDRRYGVTHNDHERAYAIDVDGKTVTFFTNQPADLLAADRVEFQRVLDSIEFEPAG